MKRRMMISLTFIAMLLFVLNNAPSQTAAKYGAIEDIEAFVTRFYKLCLGRAPDPAGLDSWVSGLLSGTMAGADVAYGFVFSQEFIKYNYSNKDYVTILYEAFFNREPDPGGYNNWLLVLNSGYSREYVLNGFIYSTEFSNLCSSYGIKPFLSGLTIVAAFNGPDAGELRGLSWDGTNLWSNTSPDGWSSKIYKHNMDSTLSLARAYGSPSFYTVDTEWMSSTLWSVDNYTDSIVKHSRTITSIDESLKLPSGDPDGIAYDGTYIWVADEGGKTIYQYNTSGSLISSISGTIYYSDLAYGNGFLWSADATTNRIYKHNIDSTLSVAETFYGPGTRPSGLAFDGRYLWVADYGTNKIYKCSTGVSYKPQDFCSGWDICDGQEVGNPPTCQSTVYKVGSGSLLVSRDNLCWKTLSTPLKGQVEFTAWALPATDSDTNFSIRLGDSNVNEETIIIRTNETNKWFANGTVVANYSLDWTKIRISIDTAQNKFSLWLDDVLVVQDKSTQASISGGINSFGLHSGRGAQPHDSYIDDIRMSSTE